MFIFPIAVLSIPTGIYMCAALLPAALLMRYIYRMDKVEKEPTKLLRGLVFRGCLAGVIAIVLELVGEFVLDMGVGEESPAYNYFLAFCVVAMAEEGAKLFLLKKYTWKNENFNYRFDAVVYAAFISLGFAAFENIGYIFTYGLQVTLARTVFAVPGHLGFSVFMGVFYGLAKKAETAGRKRACRRNLRMAYIVPVFLHGFYDACCMSESTLSSVIFFAFVAIMYVVVIRIVKKESKNDEPIVEQPAETLWHQDQ